MKVIEIVEKYLKDGGFDGLAGGDCGCEIGDLMPCCEDPADCVPGHKVPTGEYADQSCWNMEAGEGKESHETRT